MNHIYRLVWNASKHTLVAVAEIAGSRSKGSSPRIRGSRKLARRTLALAIASLLSPGIALAAQAPAMQSALQSVRAAGAGQTQPNATALPSGGQVVAGHATLHQGGATLDINQSTQRAILNWQSFDIGQNATVNFVQPDSSSIALNRILGNDASRIYGHLNANGQVFLVNPNGVLFARGAQVNVAGIVASTLGIGNQDFLDGNYRFSGSSSAGVTNQGSITAAKGGYVAFIGRTVDNEGSISTPEGSTALGAGGAVNMQLAGSGLVGFHVSQSALKAQATNGGIIAANGGTVLLTAQAKNALLETVVNNTGVIRAQTATDHDGTIELLGGDSGTVNVAGTLDARAPNGGAGGTIETSGLHVKVADSAVITTQAASGHDGRWTIDPNNFTVATSGGDITGSALSTALASGNVTIQTTSGAASCTGATCGTGSSGNGDIEVNDSVSWSANVLTLDAYRNIDINTQMNGSGSAGLALQYGQGASNGVIGGSIASYNVNAPVNLASGGSFTTKLGSGGSVVSYTIITSLGTQGSTTQTDLQGINGGLAGNYVLGANIDASATSGWNGGAGFAPIGPSTGSKFAGTFDGLRHTVNGLIINRPATDYVGLFGANAGTIRHVGMVGGSVSGSSNVGGLVGRTIGSITDAYSTGSVSGSSNVGGLIGWNYGATSAVYATGSVSGSINVGGLAGKNFGGMITDAYATGSVSGISQVGGLVGENSTTISDVYATGVVAGAAAGGLAGINYGTITDAYATGNVIGGWLGGLVGTNYGTISDVYATGVVASGTHNGGLVGTNVGGTINNGYWNTTTSGQTIGIGGGTATGATGLTTAEMMQASNFAGWSIDTNGSAGKTTPWRIYEGHTMPLLTAFLKPLAVTVNDSSQVYDGTVQTSAGGYAVTGSYDASLVLGTASGGGRNVGTYALNAGLYSTQQGYNMVITGGTLTITKATLTLTGLSASDKIYDATTAATTSGTLSGILGSDTVAGNLTASFDDKNAGTGKTVTIDGITLSGTDAGNYQIATGQTTTADISKATLTLTGLVADNKVYDATNNATATGTLSGILGSDTVADNLTASFDNKNWGTGKTVTVDGITLSGTDAGNYQIADGQTTTADISKATLTLTDLVVADKPTDGTTLGTISNDGSLVGVLSDDAVTLDGSQAVANFASAQVGEDQMVDVTGLALTGTDAGNYLLASPQVTHASILPTPANGGGTGQPSGQPGQNSGTGVAGATMQAGYPGVVSGPSSQLDPRWMFTLVQGPGKSPHVDFQIVNAAFEGDNGTANGSNQTCTNAGGFSPFASSGGTCAKNKSNEEAGI